ncbi:MAG: GreA/GreB family elongation factor [Opitutaceae bacterium]
MDETDLDRGDVSWLSPLARALLNAGTGQRVRVKTPRGEAVWEIVSIVYEAAPGPAPEFQTRQPN